MNLKIVIAAIVVFFSGSPSAQALDDNRFHDAVIHYSQSDGFGNLSYSERNEFRSRVTGDIKESIKSKWDHSNVGLSGKQSAALTATAVSLFGLGFATGTLPLLAPMAVFALMPVCCYG